MKQHFKLFKPYGYLSQFLTRQNKAKNKKMLGEFYDFPEGTMAAGRLDEASEGMLILTTDGKTSAKITKGGVEKEYYAQVDGAISSEAITQLKQGIQISIEGKKYQTKPCQAKIIANPTLPKRAKKIRDARHGPTSWISLILTEGKYRQVRKMTAAVGFPTLRLVRIRIGNQHIEKMQPGEVIEITNNLESYLNYIEPKI